MNPGSLTKTYNAFEQGLLRYLTTDQLKAIQSVKVGIGGAGGLGSNCAMILVRSGFTRLEILDQDLIDASNLNRQHYYLEEIGHPKVEILKERLLAINPDADITIHQVHWNTQTGNLYFKDCDYVVEAFDQAEWKYKLVDYYHDKVKHVVSGIGMAGLMEKKPMTIKTVGNITIIGDRCTDTAHGHPPMAPRVTACAAMMAEIVLDLALGIKI
ncbi:MAG: sulfur carrier protein ThiS adenylyltransferase ThiF [Candidatus Omnitrophota bacterium]|nr:sulfur carrier protein ThiS adenylyltransferase ThiF [Candidatus Omnitrophota bacterium]MDZ4243276.1 sulfur carrier protein ThiS adenylyltransferase ThiF [Candidatus Omnitrophota bacterium]